MSAISQHRSSCLRTHTKIRQKATQTFVGGVLSRTYRLATYSRLKPSGHYMYRQFNIQQFYVLPTQCIYVFCVDLRTNSHYFPIQH